ncbi:hypothetical protein ACFTTN_03305 [Streptomyces niveus]|uniref:hypothetical protein n=1 Tax=Streptomyces niveus TaxID=193462 RepID=UPI0036273F6A
MTSHWTAGAAQAALDLLEAARERIESALKVAHPGDPAARHKATKAAPVRLAITLDTSDLEQVGVELHAFNAQVNGIRPGSDSR